MTNQERLQARRAERARSGSRRRRDLEAAAELEERQQRERVERAAGSSEEARSAWSQAQPALREMVGDTTYDLWFAELSLVGEDGQTLVVEGPALKTGFVRRRYPEILAAALRSSPYKGIAFVAAPRASEDEVRW